MASATQVEPSSKPRPSVKQPRFRGESWLRPNAFGDVFELALTSSSGNHHYWSKSTMKKKAHRTPTTLLGSSLSQHNPIGSESLWKIELWVWRGTHWSAQKSLNDKAGRPKTCRNSSLKGTARKQHIPSSIRHFRNQGQEIWLSKRLKVRAKELSSTTQTANYVHRP